MLMEKVWGISVRYISNEAHKAQTVDTVYVPLCRLYALICMVIQIQIQIILLPYTGT